MKTHEIASEDLVAYSPRAIHQSPWPREWTHPGGRENHGEMETWNSWNNTHP